MNDLFKSGQLERRRGAGPLGSVAVHLVLLAVLISGGHQVHEQLVNVYKPVRLVAPQELAPRAKALPVRKLPKPKVLEIPKLARVSPAPILHALPEPPKLTPAVEPKLVITEHHVPAPVTPSKPPAPSSPAVTFAAATNQPAPILPRSAAAPSAFDAAGTGSRPAAKAVATETGAFGGPVVESAKSRATPGTLAGFSNAASSAPEAHARTVSKSSGFGEVRTAEARSERNAAPLQNPDTPVRIISKPKPAYTEEARKLRIEGSVVLEVTFTASGSVQVIRVVRGLGHGLDESAALAARSLSFQPAQRDGRPVDVTANVRIEFQLTS